MAKLKKYRKAPKAGASLQTWEKYKAHIIEVDKQNNAMKADKTKKENLKKMVQKIKAKR